MDIKEQLMILSEICQQDLQIINAKEKLIRLNRESQDAKNAACELLKTIEALGTHNTELLKRRKILDEKLQLEKANLRKWESRAEKIKGEREYTALMSEIGAQKRTITGVEAELSEIMSELKSGDEKINKASGAHEEKISSANRAYESVRELLDEQETELSKKEAIRQSYLSKLPKTVQVKYERIYEKRNQQGIAVLSKGICQACMRMVPHELFNRVCKGEVIEQCPSCQRIVVTEFEKN
jgi:predicted  nucleic acid-binding Zn-ribbon protein